MKNYCVYIHRQASDNKIFYVGKGTPSRPRSLSGRSDHWRRIVNKHGLKISLVKIGMNEECALSYEKALIAALGRNNLCNHTDGGDGCRNPSDETRRKMSLAKIGLTKSRETIEKHAAKLRGKKMPLAAIERTRAAHLGSKRSEEAKARMRAASRLRWDKPGAKEAASISAQKREARRKAEKNV